MRSWLFVPGENDRMMAKAPTLTADIIVFDLEDAVAPQRKEAARQLVRRTIETGGLQARVYVRLNGLHTGMTRQDIESVVVPGLSGVMLPKAEGPGELKGLDTLLREAEEDAGIQPGTLEVAALVETPTGVLNAHTIALSSRVVALALGGEDLAAALGAERTQLAPELLYARGRVVMAAAAATIQAIDTVWVDVRDDESLRKEACFVRNLGFTGKLAIHPRQVPIINEAFSPSEEELTQAARIAEAFNASDAGVVTVDGKMVDEPVVRRARRLLALASRDGR
jgi:citrate lyase subunit beta/citryl-CoA lyase